MTDVFVVADNIVSPLGNTTVENFEQLKVSVSGIQLHHNTTIAPEPFYAALFSNNDLPIQDGFTRFESLLLASIQRALNNSDIDTASDNTILIISSTKGNISLLEREKMSDGLLQQISLSASAKRVAEKLGFVNRPIVVSNACISGVLGIVTGMRLLQQGIYDTAVVTGADEITKFILSGFQSFQAISAEPCKPFDKDRTGISLGEGAATVILSSNKKYAGNIKVTGGATGNDANHISGPSRTGQELSHVIQKTMQEANLSSSEIDFISAHGTATAYNDEMEAKAIALAGLVHVPVNSLKAYYGHTLGAAGLIEAAITLQSMRENIIIPTKGFEQLGVSKNIQLSNTLLHKSLQHCLKTASGFGGCNGALMFSKI